MVSAAPAAAQDPDAPIHSPYQTAQLVDGVRIMATPPDHLGFAVSNIVLVEHQDGIVVVDSGATRRDGDEIVSYIRSFTKKPVKALVYTHWHNDHIQGASQIRAAWPKVRVIATQGTRAGIDGPARSQGLDYKPNPAAVAKIAEQLEEAAREADKLVANPDTTPWLKLRYSRMAHENRAGIKALAGTHFVAPTEILGPKDIVIADPRLPVEIKFLGRANTDGDAIVWLPNQRLVATGDVVVSPVPFGFGSYPTDWIATLRKIKELPFDLLVPGHGLPQSDSAYLDRLIEATTALRGEVGKLAAQGLSLEQVREKLEAAAIWKAFGGAARREAGFQQMWLRPMIESAYKEAKGIPIVQGEGELPS